MGVFKNLRKTISNGSFTFGNLTELSLSKLALGWWCNNKLTEIECSRWKVIILTTETVTLKSGAKTGNPQVSALFC